MIKVTKEEALGKITEKEYVSVVWSTEGCPNCEYFEEILEGVEAQLPNWSIYKVEVPFLSQDLMFEPSMYPTNFIFDKGVRKVVAVGLATADEVLETFRNIESGNFKTDEEVMEELMNALDKQE